MHGLVGEPVAAAMSSASGHRNGGLGLGGGGGGGGGGDVVGLGPQERRAGVGEGRGESGEGGAAAECVGEARGDGELDAAPRNPEGGEVDHAVFAGDVEEVVAD